MPSPKNQLKSLGKQVQTAQRTVETIPWKGGDCVVKLDCSEFTSHCPVTSQPDFAQLSISYRPDKAILETKSLKLYLWKFRNTKNFNESITNEIADYLNKALLPKGLIVEGRFFARGGISVTCRAERGMDEQISAL